MKPPKNKGITLKLDQYLNLAIFWRVGTSPLTAFLFTRPAAIPDLESCGCCGMFLIVDLLQTQTSFWIAWLDSGASY